MVLYVDQASSSPIYQQIRDQVVAAIARGELRPGDGLPSVRALASDHHLILNERQNIFYPSFCFPMFNGYVCNLISKILHSS